MHGFKKWEILRTSNKAKIIALKLLPLKFRPKLTNLSTMLMVNRPIKGSAPVPICRENNPTIKGGLFCCPAQGGFCSTVPCFALRLHISRNFSQPPNKVLCGLTVEEHLHSKGSFAKKSLFVQKWTRHNKEGYHIARTATMQPLVKKKKQLQEKNLHKAALLPTIVQWLFLHCAFLIKNVCCCARCVEHENSCHERAVHAVCWVLNCNAMVGW